MSTEMSRHFIHFLQVSKKMYLKSEFIHFLYDIILVYSPGAGADSPPPRGQNLKALSLYPFVARFKEISLKSDFIHIFSF